MGRNRHSYNERATRFWAKVDIKEPDKCWLWKGSINISGYGVFGLDGKNIGAHRMAYILSNGSIDDKLIVLHSCDNRLCCNPSHLRQGTSCDNVRDALERNRYYNSNITHCPRGHEYVSENVYLSKDGKRSCRKCALNRIRERKESLLLM